MPTLVTNFGEVEQSGEAAQTEAEVPTAPEPESKCAPLDARFAWRYPYASAVELPSKVTATELKSLPEPDPESAELVARALRPFRTPELGGTARGLTAAERGTATHLALRYIDLAALHSADEAREAVDALVLNGRLSRQEADAVDARSIYALASSELGKSMAAAEKVWREFSFSLLRPASEVFPGAADDDILIQGVVDCCFVEGDELIVVDYKTDRIPALECAERAERYRSQLECYAWAMESITGKRVRESIIYFLAPAVAVRL